MIKYKISSKLFFVFILLYLGSCNEKATSNSENAITCNTSTEVKIEIQKLTDVVFKNGDIVSADFSPNVIKAKKTCNLLGENILTLDVGDANDFVCCYNKNVRLYS